MQRAQEVLGIRKYDKEEIVPNQKSQIELGRKLFFDSRLSKDGTTSCAKCHNPSHFGTDSRSKSIGVGGLLTSRNTQSVFNLRYQHFFHWRLDRTSLEDQALKAFTD